VVAIQKFNRFGDMMLRGEHHFAASISGGSGNVADTFKLALTNDVPAATDQVYDDVTLLPAPAAADGYPAGGATLTIGLSLTGSSVKVTFADITFTAGPGKIGPFRYGFIYNDRGSSNYLVGFFDHGSSITLNDGEVFKADFDATNGAFTLS
jgi:hypothetical protein